jgi:hypothetical protein
VLFPQKERRAHEAPDVAVYRIAVDISSRLSSTAAESQNERDENRYDHDQCSDYSMQFMYQYNY